MNRRVVSTFPLFLRRKETLYAFPLPLMHLISRISSLRLMCSSSSSPLIDSSNLLYRTPATFRGGYSGNELIDVDVVYQDSHHDFAPHNARATCIALHGSPGSHKDFKYMLPYFVQKGIRLIAINYPGHGFVEYDKRLSWENKERNEYVKAVFDSLGLSAAKRIIFLGHSRACENALKLAQSHSERGEDVISAMLVNSPGLRVHRGSRPRWIISVMVVLIRLQNSWIDYFIHPLLEFVYNKIIGLKVANGKIAAAAIQPIVTMEYEKMKDTIKSVRENDKLRVIHAWGGDDFLIEPNISIEYANEFGQIDKLQCHTKDPAESQRVRDEAVQLIRNGSKVISIGFDKEGHYIQKYRASLLVDLIDEIVQMAEEKKKEGKSDETPNSVLNSSNAT